jgi:hypothetical protein
MLKTLPIVVGPAQRICAWCWMELAAGTLPPSHGICPACYVRLENNGGVR